MMTHYCTHTQTHTHAHTQTHMRAHTHTRTHMHLFCFSMFDSTEFRQCMAITSPPSLCVAAQCVGLSAASSLDLLFAYLANHYWWSGEGWDALVAFFSFGLPSLSTADGSVECPAPHPPPHRPW